MLHIGTSFTRSVALVTIVLLVSGTACTSETQDTQGGIMPPAEDSYELAEDTQDLAALVGTTVAPVNLPIAAPQFIATVVHGLAESRVALTELRTGRSMLLPATDAVPADPVWAPDRGSILFRVEDELMYYRLGEDRLRSLGTELSAFGATPYAYSPDGRSIAAVEATGVRVFPAGGGADRGTHYPLPEGSRFAELLWSTDGGNLFVLAISDAGGPSSLVQIDTAAQSVDVRSVPDIVDLLGWDPPTHGLVVVSEAADRVGNGTTVLLPSGELRAFRDAEEDGAGELLLAHRSDTQQTVVMLRREDLGDPARLLVLGPGQTPPRPWLTRYAMLTDLSLSANGQWAAFVDTTPMAETGESSGHIYIAAFGTDDATLVLRADPESHAFATPAFSQ
jgi:hypothetical protein